MNKRNIKEGISLIVLIITIIVMIILATAIIISLTNNNIINQANTAVNETNLKNMQEAANIALGQLLLDNNEPDIDKIREKMKDNGISDTELSKYNITYNNGKISVSSPSSSLAWNGEVSSSIEVDSQDTDVYNIYTAADLAYVASQVNNGSNNFSGKTIKLMNDIDFGATWNDSQELVTGNTWTGIGRYIVADEVINTNYVFMGNFDGNGKTIENIYCKNNTAATIGDYTSVYFSGLIDLAIGSTISNLTVKDSCVIGTQVGAIVGAGDSVTITNCHNNNSDIYGNFGDSVTSFAGGIVGSIPNANISDCSNSGNITSNSHACGIIGLVDSGYSVTNCTNTGELSGTVTGDLYIEN